MANNNRPQERQWASDETYTKAAYDSVDIQLPREGSWLRVNEVPPLKMAELTEEYNLEAIGEELEEHGDVSFEEARDGRADIPDAVAEGVGSTVDFLREIIVPAVIRPENAHWNNPPESPDATEVFDLSTLHEDDLDAVIEGVAGGQLDDEDVGDEAVDDGGDYQGRFQGQQDRH